MFGHQDNQSDGAAVEPLLSMNNDSSTSNASNSSVSNDFPIGSNPTPPDPVDNPTSPLPPPSPASDNKPMSDDFDNVAAQLSDDDDSPAQVDTSQADPADDLLSLKQQALQQLSPLMDHLDQTPEEKFKTTMMMIQAADNKALIPDAYQAAQQITDEKTKAQALLDVINEINYFTQHKAN